MILYNAASGIASITLNRPEKRNALSAELIETLSASLARSARDPEVRVVVLGGAGQDFCAGMDLVELHGTADQSALDHVAAAQRLADVFLAMRQHPRPVVAAVRGRALAGGCGLATACDLVLASESAQFGYTEVRLGFVPAMVASILRRSVNEKRAFELITTGEIISAEEAQLIGITNHVYSDSDFEARVSAFVAALASKPASAVSLAKKLLYHIDGMGFETAIEAGVHVNALARMTDDARRGIAAFVKKS